MMAGPKPCLGYPSRSAACRAMRARGHSNKSIAEKTGIPPAAVGALLAKSKQPANFVGVTFADSEMANLREVAGREGWSVADEIKARCFEEGM